jgi:hypothetical protein
MLGRKSSTLTRMLLASAATLAPAVAHAENSNSASLGFEMTSPPAGFSELEQPRDLVVDLYFGGRKIGEAQIVAKPGVVRFRNPDQIIGLVPHLKSSPALVTSLTAELKDNAGLACSQTNSGHCGELKPDLVGIIFDQDRFRLDLFVHPSALEVTQSDEIYLATPTAPLSLTSSIGAAIAGSTRGSTSFNIQNRTIIGFQNARIRSDSSIASDLGLVFDDLVAEVDTRRHRYSGGLFWAPGADLTGRRRIMGFGFATQFDTRADADSLEATPLIIFLGQPARVEILVDNRLVTSGSYEAGNNSVDTSNLPDGSYPLVLRIREASGAVREERRFFVKNAQISPQGQLVYFAYAGLLANTQHNQPISLSKSLYYQVGGARRLSESTAIDAAILGTEKKAMLQVGGWLITSFGRARAAGLMSSDGSKGALLQLGSAGTGPLNFNFDVRRVWSSNGEPLLPLPSYVDNFGPTPVTGAQVAASSYTQASGTLTYSLGSALLSVTGSYRHDRGFKSDYTIGPSLSWPIVRQGGLQVIVQADAQKSRTTTSAFAGFRVLYTAGGFSTLSTIGHATLKDGGTRGSRSRQVGSLSGQWFYQDDERTQVSLEGALQRDVDTSTARANAFVANQLGSGRAEVLHSLEGNGGTQFGLTLQTGIALGSKAVEIGGRDLNQSAVIASVAGSAKDAAFDVLIDEIARGRVSAGRRLPIFLEAYRSYNLRLRPVGSSAVDYDSAVRKITLFPGNVEHLNWTAEQVSTVFGQAFLADGRPLANASISTRRGVGQTDDDGYFQVDVEANEPLTFKLGANETCEVPLVGAQVQGDYASLGRVVCR